MQVAINAERVKSPPPSEALLFAISARQSTEALALIAMIKIYTVPPDSTEEDVMPLNCKLNNCDGIFDLRTSDVGSNVGNIKQKTRKAIGHAGFRYSSGGM